MTFAKVAVLDELWGGELTRVVVGKRPVLLVRTGETVVAYEDRCAHLGVPLSQGRLEGTVLTCSAHEWQYDVTTGRGINPATACLRRFDVRGEEGQVWVDVDPAGA
jgi:toluene monooxygenase system ferredoxin subunit